MEFHKGLDELNEKVIYYFKTPDGKPYKGNTNIKFVGKNNKIYYTGKTYTKYSQLLEHIPKGFSVSETHFTTNFTYWGVQPRKEVDYSLDPIFGEGQSIDDDYKRNILGYQLVARDNTGRKDILLNSANDNKVRELFEKVQRLNMPSGRTQTTAGSTQTAASGSPAGSSQATASPSFPSPTNTGGLGLFAQNTGLTPFSPQDLTDIFNLFSPPDQPQPVAPFSPTEIANIVNLLDTETPPETPPATPQYIPFQNAITPAGPRTPPRNQNLAAAAGMEQRPVTPEPRQGTPEASSSSQLTGSAARRSIEQNLEGLRAAISKLPADVQRSRAKIAGALNRAFGVSEAAIVDTLKSNRALYQSK
jgi:hypothetical protein